MIARLIKIRKALGLSQGKMASRLKVTAVYYNRVEKKQYKLSENLIDRLYTRYGVNPSWLKTGKGAIFDYSSVGFIRSAYEVRNDEKKKYIDEEGVKETVELILEKSMNIQSGSLW